MIPLMACEDSETIPPEGSIITVAGNPAIVVLQNGIGSSDIIATVRSELGVPLPGQDVRFSQSSGLLHFVGTLPIPANSAANIPIPTDSFGNSTVTLTTSATTIVTATSGNATGSLTLNTAKCTLSQITLNVDNSTDSLCAGASTPNVTSCQQDVCFVAQVLCTSSVPADGVTVLFSLQNNTVMGRTFNATFDQSQVTTDAMGFARTMMTPNSDCNNATTGCAGNQTCQAEALAEVQGGSLQSDPLQLVINIP